MAAPSLPSPARMLLAAVALLLGGACSADVEGPSDEEARQAGREYGEVIVDTISARATQDEMEGLCGQGAAGDDSPRQVDAFVEGCLEVVSNGP